MTNKVLELLYCRHYADYDLGWVGRRGTSGVDYKVDSSKQAFRRRLRLRGYFEVRKKVSGRDNKRE